MHEREYKRLKAQIESRYRADLSALERVWQMAQSSEPPSKPARAQTEDHKPGLFGQMVEEFAPEASLVERARAALPPPGTAFTVRFIEAKIRNAYPDMNGSLSLASLSSTLKRFADKGEIHIKIAGAGKRATVFEVPMSG
jgi:hypothetical protein